MLGAIIGDIVGSRFEWNNNRSKQFEFLTYKCSVTDDSIMSLAIAKALLESKADYSDLSENAVKYMQEIGRHYPDCGYGGQFRKWIFSDDPKPYGSYGNGAAMRVSACGFVGNSLEETKQLSKAVTIVTHNHPEGLKGAEATAVAIFLARTGKSLLEIRDYKEETLLGQQTFNDTGYSKHANASSISGTIDAGGQYVATSWNNSWSANAKISDIPDKAVAKVQYKDGIATVEKQLTFTDAETKIFFAAEAVYALFTNPLADVDELVLADGVTQEQINTASGLVDEVTVKPEQNKVVLLEMIAKANNLLNPEQGSGNNEETGEGTSEETGEENS
jgi:hypothetical protein